MAVTYDFQTPGVSTSAADTQEDIRNIAEMSWVWHVNASPHSLTNKPTGLIEAFYDSTVDFSVYPGGLANYGYQNYYSLKAFDGTNLGNVNFGELYVHNNGAVLSNTVGIRGREFISMGLFAGYACESSAVWSINADYGNSGTSTFDPVLSFYNQVTERARIYTDTSDSHKLKFDVGGSDQMVIDSSGNVGIGTSSPSQPLVVKKVSGSSTAFAVTDSSDTILASVYVSQSQGGILTVANNAGTNNVFLSSYGNSYLNGGNVGIGTSSPNTSLQISRTVATNNTVLNTFSNLQLLNPTGSYTFGNIIGAISFGKTAGHGSGMRAGIVAKYSTTGTEASNIGTDLVFRTALNSAGDSSEKMIIDSSGNVGIGTSSPGAELDLRGALSNAPGGFQFGLGSSTSSYFGIRLDTSGDVCFDTYKAPWTETLKIDRSSGDFEISTGNLVIGTSGKGIDFSATSGTGTSELLDDYEEGTFTPQVYYNNGSDQSFTFTPGGGYTAQTGVYTKIGDTVLVRIRIKTNGLSGGSSSDEVRISGLPFAASSDIASYPVKILSQDFAANPPKGGAIIGGGTKIYLYRDAASTGALTNLQVSDLSGGTNNNDFLITAEYHI